jgi:AcrR family transcriptional regulator
VQNRANLQPNARSCYRPAVHETTGLRERKKAQTRRAISQAVLFLALERGLDAVTADDIAAAANVSVRTFHNYFGSKEEALVFAWQSEFQVHVEALRERPRDEPILVSLEHMLSGIVSSVVDGSPGLAAQADLLWTSLAMAEYRSVLLDEAIRMVTEVVAERTGTNAGTDLYPHLVTSATISAAVTAFQFTPADNPNEPDRERLVHECFALLRTGFER